MTNTPTQPSAELKSITGLTDQEYEALSAALAKMRAPQVETQAPHSKMLAAVRNQIQQRLNNPQLSEEERAKLTNDIADLDHKMNAIPQ